nr:unnamed protein product [Digitaria exilis]
MDPEFYKYLEEHDKDLLGFDDDEIKDDEETGISDDGEPVSKDEQKQVVKPIAMEMFDSWCDGVENEKIGSIRSILQAFRRACHYGEDQGDNSAPKFSVMSGSVLHKIETSFEFIKSKRAGITFSPNDPVAESPKGRGLQSFLKICCYSAPESTGQDGALDETSVIVGAESSTFSRRLTEAQKQQDEPDDDEGTIAFSKNFPTEKKPKTTKEKNKKRPRDHDAAATEEDLVEDLVLSSDDEDTDNQGSDEDDSVPVEDDSDEDFVDPDSEYKKQKKAELKNRNMRPPLSNNKTKRKARPKKKTKH